MMVDNDDRTPVLEAWVSHIPGRISVALEDLRTGRTRTVTIKGKGQILRITDVDRELVEERIRDEVNNPFRNGMLHQQGAAEKSPQSMTDEDLVALFELETTDFQGVLDALSEVNVRRLKELSVEHNASYGHVGAVRDYIEEKYPIGGDTQTYRDLMADRESAAR